MCINGSYRGSFGIHWKSLKYTEKRLFFATHYILKGDLLCGLRPRQPLIYKFLLQNPVTVRFAIWTEDALTHSNTMNQPYYFGHATLDR
jgi:hypothetical protein